MLIKFGDYNNNYKYIFFVVIFNYLSYYLNNGNLNQFLYSFNLIKKETDNLYIHPFIGDNFNYLGIIIISFILYKIKEKKSGINKKNDENKDEVNISEIKLIHTDIKENINQNISFLNLVFLLSYWVFIDHITRIIQSLMIFDYWMFELFCICIITSKLLKITIYTHQILGIVINSVSCLIIGIIKFIILNDHYNSNTEDKNIYYFNIEKKWFIPISLLIYLLIIISTSYIYTKLKFYMDLRFISQTKLLILYGIIGFALTTIACLIETLFKCVGNVRDFFCKINIYYEDSDDTENNEDYDSYIENIFMFFEDFSALEKKDIIIEIFLFFFGIIFYYCSLYFEILVIKYLTPMHFMFSSLIYLFFNEIRELINILIIKNKGTKDNDDNIDIKDIPYLLNISLFNILTYIFSLIGFMIYLEIIELNFCNLNFNLRKYINDRSIKDTYEDDVCESIINDEVSFSRSSTITNNIELPVNEEE